MTPTLSVHATHTGLILGGAAPVTDRHIRRCREAARLALDGAFETTPPATAAAAPAASRRIGAIASATLPATAVDPGPDGGPIKCYEYPRAAQGARFNESRLPNFGANSAFTSLDPALTRGIQARPRISSGCPAAIPLGAAQAWLSPPSGRWMRR